MQIIIKADQDGRDVETVREIAWFCSDDYSDKKTHDFLAYPKFRKFAEKALAIAAFLDQNVEPSAFTGSFTMPTLKPMPKL